MRQALRVLSKSILRVQWPFALAAVGSICRFPYHCLGSPSRMAVAALLKDSTSFLPLRASTRCRDVSLSDGINTPMALRGTFHLCSCAREMGVVHRFLRPQSVCYSGLCALQPMLVLLIWSPLKLLVHEHVSPIDVMKLALSHQMKRHHSVLSSA